LAQGGGILYFAHHSKLCSHLPSLRHMARVEMHPPAPIVVAQRMCDLLQSFPAAAAGGVQWQTLVRKYKERHSSKLDIEALGHGSALAAATALLWEVLRLVEAEDTDNPVVALEDSVVLTPRPGSLASWPSLYQVFCELIEKSASRGANGILLSQLKPLLQKHWHANFDESGLSYLTEEGTPVKLKKMKHLVLAVLRWREQCAAWRAAAGVQPAALDEALRLELELVPSKTHNDLILRTAAAAARPEARATPHARHVGLRAPARAHQEKSPGRDAESWPGDVESLSHRSSTSSGASSELAEELENLRAENALLRASNELLESRVRGAALGVAALPRAPSGPPPPPVEAELFDHPFEPPPELRRQGLAWGCGTSPLASTAAQSSYGLSADSPPPWSQASSSRSQSGSATPASFSTGGNQVCALVPVWFPLGDRGQIPSGVVQQVRTVFERSGEALPSFFAQR